MELGQIVDYCTEWNNAHKESDSNSNNEEGVTVRDATQEDWDEFFGG